MNLYEAKKILNKNGYKLIKESTTYSFGPEERIDIEVDGKHYVAYDVTATGELTAGCGSSGDLDEFEIEPMSVEPYVAYWTDDTGAEITVTDNVIDALCEKLAEFDSSFWKTSDSDEYYADDID